jgi:rhamnose utilization protein RhaD (predicted bifunctional aldolase and dehydrogenase)
MDGMQRKKLQAQSAAPAPERREKLKLLLDLSHQLADPQHPLAILGEGNTSAKLSDETFIVKASGSCLSTLEKNNLTDAEVDGAMLESRVDPTAKKPSVEAMFHAWLLTLPGIEFVGHTHAPAVNSILCSPRAAEFAVKKIFPDEIVCCDVASVFIPYTDPGLKLSQAIRRETEKFLQTYGRPPRVILMENHGVITLGRTVQGVMSAMLMAEKTATVWIGAAALGGPKFMTPENVARISGRPDEALRRKMLKL